MSEYQIIDFFLEFQWFYCFTTTKMIYGIHYGFFFTAPGSLNLNVKLDIYSDIYLRTSSSRSISYKLNFYIVKTFILLIIQ
jgi:hypothetical protein